MKPLRWALRVALAIKAVPVPDLDIDEVLLLVVAVLLLTVYRATLRAILAESARPGSRGDRCGCSAGRLA